jgi:hypothetical protein
MRISEEDYAKLTESRQIASTPSKGIRGRGRTVKRVSGEMNGTESAYAIHLDSDSRSSWPMDAGTLRTSLSRWPTG